MWTLFSLPIWGVHENTEHEKTRASLTCMKAELHRWYEDWDKAHPDDKVTRISDITMKMVGTPDEPRLKLKAMECFGMCGYLVDAVYKYRHIVGDKFRLFHESGRALRDYVFLVKAAPMNLPTPVLQVEFRQNQF